MGETLAAQCSAINEFREFLGEESISKLSIDGDAVEFSVQTSGNKLHFLYQADDATTHHPLLLCTNQDSLNLEALNAKLAQGNYSLGKTLSSLGRQLHIDLDWALEALNELQGGDGDAGDDGSGDRASDDGNDDDDENMSEGEDQGDDILREWSKKMLQLEAIEQQKANDATKNKTASVEIDHSQKQIFDTKAAFRRLLNELEEIFKAQDMNLMVDAPGPEGLFQWEVYLAGFSSEKGNLAADLHQTGRRFGLSSVHLQITFKRGLHPFYPPSVHILSPRFQGPVLGAVACFPMLHPKVWDPVVSAKDIILNIKEFLEVRN
jgi:baculoviral IAP repeat-containing protein 6